MQRVGEMSCILLGQVRHADENANHQHVEGASTVGLGEREREGNRDTPTMEGGIAGRAEPAKESEAEWS